MRYRYTVLAMCLMSAAACNSGGSEQESGTKSAAVDVQSRVLPSDQDVMTRVFDADYRVPGDFFVDERADTPGSYSLHHVKDAAGSYELCAVTSDTALALEAADNERRAASGVFGAFTETDEYYEIERDLSFSSSVGNTSGDTSPGFSRVFKCGFVEREGVDRHSRSGYAGVLNARPLTERVVREFSQYLWQFTFFWPAEKKVLQNFSSETDRELEHTLVIALRSGQGDEKCDLIEVIDWTFRVNRADGVVTKTFNPLYSFEARVVDGVPEKCGS